MDDIQGNKTEISSKMWSRIVFCAGSKVKKRTKPAKKHNWQHNYGTAVIEGNKTDVIVTEFKNMVFIIATQVKKMGTLVEVSYPVCDRNPVTVCGDSRILLGKDEPEILAVAHHLSNRLFPFQPVLYSLALKNRSSQTVRSLGDLVETVAKSEPLKL